MKKLFYISTILVTLYSCEVDVSDEFRSQQPLFVVSGQIKAGKIPRINLSKTITMTTLDSLMLLDGATVEIGRGDDVYVLESEGKGCYRNEFLIPEPGDELRLSCTGEELPEARVLSRVPGLPLVKGMEFRVDEEFNFFLDLQLEDPADSEDYYEFFLSGWRKEISHHYLNGELVSVDTNTVFRSYGVFMIDPVMEYEGSHGNYSAFDLDSPFGSQFLFSDQQINGKVHTISVRTSLLQTYNDSIPEIYVNMIKKDLHFYNFISTYMHYDPYPDQDFLQPVQVYSNIENGFGLLYAESQVVDTIDVSQWYSDPIFQEMLNPESP